MRNKPFYRIVAIDEKEKLTGKPLDTLGYWQPDNDYIKVDHKKITAWVDKGAQVTPAVKKLAEKTK